MDQQQQQSNINKEINYSSIGMNLEQSIAQVAKGKTTYALNALVEGFDGQFVNYQNELGNEKCVQFPDGYRVIGKLAIYEVNKIVYWLANPDTRDSEIGESNIDGCIYTKTINSPCLNLSIEHPILQAVYRISNCALQVFWVDNNNPDRFLDYSSLPYKQVIGGDTLCEITTTTDIDCNKLKLNPNFSIPEIEIISVDSDGEIKTGTVQFAFQYANSNGEGYTSFYSTTNPIPIFDPSQVTLDFNSTTGKSVKIQISNIDVTGFYDYFNLAVIKTINNITTVELIGTYQIGNSSQVITYTGQNQTQIQLALPDITQKYPVYEKSGILTTTGDILIRAELTTTERLSYQEIANKIKLYWQTYRLPKTDNYKNALNSANLKSFMRDEIYPYELILLLNNGIETDGFHIPARIATSSDLDVVSNNDTDNQPLPRWRVYNTAISNGLESDWLTSTQTNFYKGPYEWGEFAYWESEEVYPCDDIWGELKGQKIRHHKFPDNIISPINDVDENIYPIGVKINAQQIEQLIQNSSLTNEQKDNIQGFKIVRGNRANNKSVVAKGLLRNVGQYVKDGSTYFFPNYPYNSIQSDPFLDSVSFPTETQSRFTFQSPDTSFYQPFVFQGQKLKLENVIYGKSQGHFQEVKNHAKYKFISEGVQLAAWGAAIGFSFIPTLVIVGVSSGTGYPGIMPAITAATSIIDIINKLIPRRNFAYQYNSIGNYNNSIAIPNNGSKIRTLDISQYIVDGFAGVSDIHSVNNFNRESSVYLKSSLPLPYPSDIQGVPIDNSRYTLSELGLCDTYTQIVERDINAYYATIKDENLSQYGQIYSYQTIDTGFQILLKDIQPGYYSIFGGDTYINKFSYKTKLRFFIDDRVGAIDESDVFYDEIGNVGKPKYWFSTDKTQGSIPVIGALAPVAKTNFDCNDGNFFYASGKMYLYAYGIPTFFCESEVNIDYRQAFNSKEGDFYPHMGTGIPDDWLQEKNVSIVYDNSYYYNKTLSRQNNEQVFTHLPLGYTFQDCKTYLPYRAVFSESRSNNPDTTQRNNWLIYKPSSYFDFPQNFGKLTSLDGMENKQVLARFTNKSLIYNGLLTMPTSQGQVYLGQSLFSSQVPPLDLADTDLGYGGSRHKFLIKFEKGMISCDDIRGNVFLIGGQLQRYRSGNNQKDLTDMQSGVQQFFTRNLEVQLPKYVKGVPVDNAFNGVGIHGIYDTRFDRLILTKIDYIPIVSGITYSKGRFYLNGNEIQLGDSSYFCNKSFTASYDFDNQAWLSFHSYIPNYYVGSSNFFISGVNNLSSTWKHLLNPTLYNNFYGEICSYIIETPTAYKYNDEILQSIQDYSKVYKYNEDETFIETDDVYFNKLILSNSQQCSGILELEPKPLNNLFKYKQYPIYNTDSKTITFTKSNSFYQVNTFWSLIKDKKKPIFLKSCESLSVDKILNQDNMDYGKRSFKKEPLRSKDLKTRFILDNRSDARIVSQFSVQQSQISYK